MRKDQKKVVNYFLYVFVIAILWGIIYVFLDYVLPEDNIFQDFFKIFTYVMIGGVVSFVLFYYFRGFYKKGQL